MSKQVSLFTISTIAVCPNHPVSIQLVCLYKEEFCERVIRKNVGNLHMKTGRLTMLQFSARQRRLVESLSNLTSPNLRKLTYLILCLRYCMNTWKAITDKHQHMHFFIQHYTSISLEC